MGILTGTLIADRVKAQFGDEAAAQIDDTKILRWINDAIRELVIENDLLKIKASANTVAGTATYTLPTDCLRLIELSYRGNPVKPLSFQQARESIPNMDDATNYPTGTCTQYWLWPDTSINLYPSPDATGAHLTIYYNQAPAELGAIANTPATPARYDNRIVEYCIAQAAELDDNDGKYAQKMSEFRQNVSNSKGDEVQPDNYYPFITDIDASPWTDTYWQG